MGVRFLLKRAFKIKRCKININARYSAILHVDYTIYSAYN